VGCLSVYAKKLGSWNGPGLLLYRASAMVFQYLQVAKKTDMDFLNVYAKTPGSWNDHGLLLCKASAKTD
jgi:hypothetical protein